MATTESRSAIVFDDPVSSLDHMHREEAADRLAEEGQHRQIVVFTHDIAFLFLLDQSCRKKDTHVAFRSVTRTDDYAGFIQHDALIQSVGGFGKVNFPKEEHLIAHLSWGASATYSRNGFCGSA